MRFWKMALVGGAAGAVTGLLGAGGGMVLIPLLTVTKELDEQEIFPSSVSIILPICILSLLFLSRNATLPYSTAFPYLLGSATGGVLSGLLGKKIPTIWLHRTLGLLILWGGVRYLC